MGRLFGTDGARGVAITELTCETAMQIGKAAAIVLTKKTKHKPTIFIGKDTRISSDVLEAEQMLRYSELFRLRQLRLLLNRRVQTQAL